MPDGRPARGRTALRAPAPGRPQTPFRTTGLRPPGRPRADCAPGQGRPRIPHRARGRPREGCAPDKGPSTGGGRVRHPPAAGVAPARLPRVQGRDVSRPGVPRPGSPPGTGRRPRSGAHPPRPPAGHVPALPSVSDDRPLEEANAPTARTPAAGAAPARLLRHKPGCSPARETPGQGWPGPGSASGDRPAALASRTTRDQTPELGAGTPDRKPRSVGGLPQAEGTSARAQPERHPRPRPHPTRGTPQAPAAPGRRDTSAPSHTRPEEHLAPPAITGRRNNPAPGRRPGAQSRASPRRARRPVARSSVATAAAPAVTVS